MALAGAPTSSPARQGASRRVAAGRFSPRKSSSELGPRHDTELWIDTVQVSRLDDHGPVSLGQCDPTAVA